MKIIRALAMDFIPASHEDPANPGSLKKVLVRKDDLVPGRLQMVNWSLLPAGKSFRNHYHEDMAEVFVIMKGKASIMIDGETAVIGPGDAVVIPARAPHGMKSTGADVEYIALGVASGTGGKTVVV